MEASSRGIPPPPLPVSMFPVKRSFSTPCDPRDEGGDDGLGDPDGCNLHLSQRLAKTPPLTPKKGGKMLALKILLLDDTVTIIQAQTKALGRVVFDQICKQLNVLESDYFGLEYQDSYGTKYWLDLEKRLSRQVGLSLGDPNLRFSVKFYTPDPSQLEEEFTRYLFSLQIKRDLATGVLQCNDNTAALMASFIVQAECGDFNDDDYPDASYLSSFKFVPHQDLEMEKRIRENHRKHCGQSPAEADLHLLETARRTELFGIKMHPAKDDEGVPLNLSVCHLGIVIFQNFTKINTFSWAKIRKLSFKRKRFILKLHPEGYNSEGYYKETVEFIFETRNDCKSFWKRCVEHHAFFRCERAPELAGASGRSKGLLTSRGSSFRYSGRTQKQMVAFVRENFVKRGAPPVAGSSSFQRSASFRSAHNVMSSGSGVSGSGGAGGGHHSGVSTSCSSPAMMSAASAVLPIDDQMDKIYPHMDYPDSPVEIRSQDSQQDTLSPGTSVTSSPQRYMPVGMVPPPHPHAHHHGAQQEVLVDQVVGPPPPQVAALYHPQYPPQDPDWLYYMCKEILATHRTFASDLRMVGPEAIALSTANNNLLNVLENLIDIKKELWEAGSHGVQVIANLLKHFENCRLKYDDYLRALPKDFQEFIDCENFQAYLPVTALALKPLYRVLYYWDYVLPVFRSYETDTIRQHCSKLEVILKPLVTIANSIQEDLESRAKVGELAREMPGFPSNPGEFLRQGILVKLSWRRGLQNRIFFLLSECMVYGSRVSSSAGFRIHGVVPLHDAKLQQHFELENQLGSSIPNSFSLITPQDKVLVLAGLNAKDRDVWVTALTEAINNAKSSSSFINSIGCSSEELLSHSQESNAGILNAGDLNSVNNNNTIRNNSHVGHRSNATIHVCWHRNVTISHTQLCKGFRCTISGFLLRKFKNSPGWQRLWVVFTNICLFFYKTFEDDTPLASLPLLGYRVETPTEADEITKDHVFKLVFKNHVYFFRAESNFTFKRWMRALSQAIQVPNQGPK